MLVVTLEDGSGRSAGRITREKSAPEDRRTREDGKNCKCVTVLKCGREMARSEIVGVILWAGSDLEKEEAEEVGYRKTDPSRKPVAKREASGDTSNAVILWGCMIGILSVFP